MEVDGYSHHEPKTRDLQVSKKGIERSKGKARGGLTEKKYYHIHQHMYIVSLYVICE
jgi:hypothetical protein